MQFCIFIGILKYHNFSCYRFMMIESEHKTADKKVFLLSFVIQVYLLLFCAMISFCKHLTGKTVSD